MGFFFTLVYIFVAYLGPYTVFGPLADYHIELVIAGLAIVGSFLNQEEATLFQMPQSFALVGLCFSIFCSFIFAGLSRKAPAALLDFLPNAFTFFFIVMNCRKKRHLQLIILVIVVASFYTIFQGYTALRANDFESPYLLAQGNDSGNTIYRLRGLAFINDPNDFAQLMVSLLSCLFFFWKAGSSATNLLFVYVPAGVLIWGMYLTHSRGAIIASVASLLIATRRKLGTVPSAVVGGLLFVGLLATGWTGGREVSVENGADRLEAWSTGLELIRAHPVFGVGFKRFADFFYITAHNSIVVCAAETGLVGLFFWLMFTVSSVRDAQVLSTPPAPVSPPETAPQQQPVEQPVFARQRPPVPVLQLANAGASPSSALDSPAGPALVRPGFGAEEDQGLLTLPEKELRRMARVLLVALTGYLTAGWFLSRTYVMTLFIYGGMVEVLYRAGLDRGLTSPRIVGGRAVKIAAFWTFALIFAVYVLLRVQHLSGK